MPKNFDTTLGADYSHFGPATDPQHMHRHLQKRLQRRWGKQVSLREFDIPRVFPRNKGGFAIQYSMITKKADNLPETKMLFYGRLLGPSETWPDYADEDNPNVFIFQDLRLIVPVFPFDPKLRQLPQFFRPDEMTHLFRRLQPYLNLKNDESKAAEHEILGYRFERRCVIRYAFEHKDRAKGKCNASQVIAKIFRPTYSEKATGLLVQLKEKGFDRDSQDRLTVPHVYFSDQKMSATFMESAPGMSLHSLTGDIIFIKACMAAGRLLRKLHSGEIKNLKPHTAADELKIFGKRIDAAGKVYPRLKGPLRRVTEQLSRNKRFSLDDCPGVCVHRDFYDKQVLYSPERTTLLDCDNMASADPALDYGNFIAHSILRRLQVPDHSGLVTDGMKAFAFAYDNSDKDFQRRVSWWIGAALTRLAALYSLRPRWRRLVPDLIAEVDIALTQNRT